MSMVSVKTIEIAGVKVPDLSKCKDIFEKYSKFYKEEDALEILGAIARNIDVVKLFLESVNCQLNGQKLVVIFTFIDQKRMLKQGKCIWLTENGTIIVWKFAASTLVLAFVLEALYLFINIAAAMDFLGRM